MKLSLSAPRGRPPIERKPALGWPAAAGDDDAFRVAGRICGGYELLPLNLELMAEAEREATLENLAALYDAIPGSFQLLSVPTGRSPVEHLDAIRPAVDALGERVFRPYAANYHEISTAPARPPRRSRSRLHGRPGRRAARSPRGWRPADAASRQSLGSGR